MLFLLNENSSSDVKKKKPSHFYRMYQFCGVIQLNFNTRCLYWLLKFSGLTIMPLSGRQINVETVLIMAAREHLSI